MRRIEKALRLNNLVSTVLFGKLKAEQRDENLAQFRGDPSCNIFLCSLGAGGVGIDLRCAQRVYLMVSNFSHIKELGASELKT